MVYLRLLIESTKGWSKMPSVSWVWARYQGLQEVLQWGLNQRSAWYLHWGVDDWLMASLAKMEKRNKLKKAIISSGYNILIKAVSKEVEALSSTCVNPNPQVNPADYMTSQWIMEQMGWKHTSAPALGSHTAANAIFMISEKTSSLALEYSKSGTWSYREILNS